jgi:hypothetical protein
MIDDWISPDHRPVPPGRAHVARRSGACRRTAASSAAHIVSLEDRPKLEALMGDESTPVAFKMLASIIHHLTHTPTEGDKKTLRELLQHACHQ